jgi:hypothetical protein
MFFNCAMDSYFLKWAWRGRVRRGTAWQGKARRGKAGHGEVGQGMVG